MAILARKFLCVSASSAPAERLFSSAGNTQTKKRNRLNFANLEKLVYLHDELAPWWNMPLKAHSLRRDRPLCEP